MTMLDDFEWRNTVAQVTSPEGLVAHMQEEGASAYAGFDPSASSLHVGHLLPVIVLARLQRAGVRPIALIGGATGLIGDPSGRASERQMLSAEAVESNRQALERQIHKLLDPGGPHGAVVVNNADWIRPWSHLDWLRDIGKYFTINYMLAKESVKSRLEGGISYTEFSYMLLQAFDFLHLFDSLGCRIQVGGSDQWGNITAGVDLVRKLRSTEVFGLTIPLLMTSSGEKFGKSAGNAVWLDPSLTTTFQFYQFWRDVPDADVIGLIKLFTFLDLKRVEEIEEAHRSSPERAAAQEILASEVTTFVHGARVAQLAEKVSRLLFYGDWNDASGDTLQFLDGQIPTFSIDRSALQNSARVVDFIAATGAVNSKSEIRRLIAGGGLTLNNVPIASPDQRTDINSLIDGRFGLLRIGKKNYSLLVMRDDQRGPERVEL